MSDDSDVVEGEVRKLGSGAYIPLPKSWRSRTVRVELLSEEESDD